MPRSLPFIQADIDARLFHEFCEAKQNGERTSSGGRDGHSGCRWNFDSAIEALSIEDPKTRRECQRQLTLIFERHKLTQVALEQETPARKAAAFRRAPRWDKRRRSALRLFERAAELHKRGLREDAKRLNEEGKLLWQSTPWLPPALEQEAAQLQVAGRSPVQSFAELDEHYRRLSRLGRKKSDALRNTIHALEATAYDCNKNLELFDPSDERRVKNFVLAALDVVEIVRPGPDDNPSKFNKLRVGYEPPAEGGTRRVRPRKSRTGKERCLAEFNKRFGARIQNIIGAELFSKSMRRFIISSVVGRFLDG
jgi:hypothetical protein